MSICRCSCNPACGCSCHATNPLAGVSDALIFDIEYVARFIEADLAERQKRLGSLGLLDLNMLGMARRILAALDKPATEGVCETCGGNKTVGRPSLDASGYIMKGRTSPCPTCTASGE